MDPLIQSAIATCGWFPSHYLLFSQNVYLPFLYYSHFGSALPAFIIAFFVFFKNKYGLPGRALLASTVFFCLWIFCDVVLWATEFPRYTIFFWALINLFEPFVHFFAFYFVYTSLYNKHLDPGKLSLALLPLLPTVLLTPTKFSILGYYLGDCDRNTIEGIMAFYGYGIEILYSLLAVITLIIFITRNHNDDERKKALYLGAGVLAFLASFSFGNIIESLTSNWYLAQTGLFGVPIFVALLAYVIVRFKAFNTKLISTQAFVAALWILTLSSLFVRTIGNIRIIIGINLILTTGLGYLLVRGVKREIQFREQLQLANTRQQETMRFITHEVKGYLTDGAAALDALRTGAFGPATPDMQTMIGEALTKNRAAVREIQNFLRIADFKTGTVSYGMRPFDFKKMLEEALVTPLENAKAKGLELTTTIAPANYTVVGDGDQIINHVIVNLVNNAINYTPKGSVDIRLEQNDTTLRFSVKDSGVGLSDEDKKVLFTEGGHGKESRLVNPHSTGYGLFIAKQIVDAHHGRIWAESAGRGTGSTFFVELPANLRPTPASLVSTKTTA